LVERRVPVDGALRYEFLTGGFEVDAAERSADETMLRTTDERATADGAHKVLERFRIRRRLPSSQSVQQ
jgi:hypothetical protein